MIPLPFSIKLLEKKDNKAVFEIEGLYPGYGVTIGNSLRRALLSSLDGAAITQVRIKGAQHEFSALQGVLEDMLRITLNLKQIRCKLYGSEPQKMELLVKGEKEVVAGDFKAPSQVEIINKNAHIATLGSKSSSLQMEVLVERGLGYESADKRKREKLEIGTILLDAIFTPIKNVSFRVENIRVGDRTDFDRLFLEIKTDGTIASEDAIFQASDVLASHFIQIRDAFPRKEVPAPKETTEDVMKMPIEELKFSTRTLNALLANNIKTVGGLLKRSEAGVSELEGLGEKGLQEIKRKLKKLGLALK